MPAWNDDAFVLALRRHGETSAVVSFLTQGHGRHAGLVRGASGKRLRGVLQPGNRVALHWTARLEEQLGLVTVEPVAAHAAAVLDDRGRLAALSSACALADTGLPERDPMPALFTAFAEMLAALPREDWAAAYVRWEIALLAELGYGLDLGRCAATGATADLAYVSPKSGCAVSAAAGAPYRGKLLPLPGFLLSGGPASPEEALDGLRLTGWFLEHHALQRPLPAARERLIDTWSHAAREGGAP